MNFKNLSSHSENLTLLKLVRLISPSFPIGTYSYSQGMEFAISSGWIIDESSALDWIQGIIEHSLVNLDLPIFFRLYESWYRKNIVKVNYWNDLLLASRDTFEFQQEERQVSKALARLLIELDLCEAELFLHTPDRCFLTLFALASVRWKISLDKAASGFLWMWAENQVLVAIKLIPLGQTAGQKILSTIIEKISKTVARALVIEDEDIGYSAPGICIASALHETQYCRLFRS